MSIFKIKEKWLVSDQDIVKWRHICMSMIKEECPEPPAGISPLEWVQYLKRQRISGILYGIITDKTSLKPEQSAIVKELKEDYIRLQSLRKIREKEASIFLEKLSGRNIEPMILKGLYLQTMIYGQDLVRPSSDIDILIENNAEHRQAVELASACGYRKFLYFSDAWEQMFMKSTTMIPDEKGIYFEVDIHRSLMYGIHDKRRKIDLVLMSGQNYMNINFMGFPARVLTPEANFVYMAYHALEIHHDCRSLLWLYDIMQLYDNKKFSKTNLDRLAQEADCEELVNYALYLVGVMKGETTIGCDSYDVKADNKGHSFREKLENVDGVMHKAIWLGLWLLPSKEYLSSYYDMEVVTWWHRAKYIVNKIRLTIMSSNKED